MHFLGLATFALGVGLSFASPAPNNHVRHEKRAPSSDWIRRVRAAPEMTLPVRIGLSQRNLHLGHNLLMEISDPRSEKYGQHMSAEEVGDLFRPADESVDAVREWLHSSGIDNERHDISAGRAWLKFDASVDELENLLATEYHLFHHLPTQQDHIGCSEYHVPKHIQEHIDFITPTVTFSKVKTGAKIKRGITEGKSSASLQPHFTPAGTSQIAGLKNDASSGTPGTEVPCYIAVTPGCLQELYGIPNGTTAAKGNELGIFEDGDFYDQDDLDLTFAFTAPYIPNGTHPKLQGINGGVAPYMDSIGVESLLDMTLIMPLIWPQTTILFQVDDEKEVELSAGFGDTFLDALDASYCTFDGGDDPNLDPQYPDTAPNLPNETFVPNGTWDKPKMCGAYKPTNVISVSYGLGEDAFSFAYEDRQCQEYMKLGLQGVSVIYASGDSGVSNRGECIVPANATNNATAPGAFSPSFPAACPYLTSVGATMLENTEEFSEVAVAVPAEAFWSGGGFSNYWPTPDYQASTVSDYLSSGNAPDYGNTAYGTPTYNVSGRGYPDVAAIGQNIILYAGGIPGFVGGTSASAPIFASIISLINEQRIAAGKGTVGFLNPTLYQNPDAFNDITSGNNPGCGTDGFSAVKGWDPVTGLGTPIFDKLSAAFLALP